MNFRYGLIVGSEINKVTQRMMIVAPDDKGTIVNQETWTAIVILDDDDPPLRWTPGSLITLSPTDRGLHLIEESL